MPIRPTFPGVYVQEVAAPGIAPAIAGVATSVAAFVDAFGRGPLDVPLRLAGMPDLQREFGGLHPGSPGSYALRQFFANGGTQALGLRVAEGAVAASALLPGRLRATAGRQVEGRSLPDPGSWGNALELQVDPEGPEQFSLTIREGAGQGPARQQEVFRELTLAPGAPRDAVAVVNAGSRLVQLARESPAADALLAAGPAVYRLSGGQDGTLPVPAAALLGDAAARTGLQALADGPPFGLLCLPRAADLPGDAMRAVLAAATRLCEGRRAMLLVDLPGAVADAAGAVAWMQAHEALRHPNAAAYFPRIQVADPLAGGLPRSLAPSGTIAGLHARFEAQHGVWKAPAGGEARLEQANGLDLLLTDRETSVLNPLGLNVLRAFPTLGLVCWGSRTLAGGDAAASEFKYVPVRRLALFLERSLLEGLAWTVFEQNDARLWDRIRQAAESFLQSLFRQGAFQGATPREAFFNRCDATTTTPQDIAQGRVNLVLGFAPLRPAEFILLRLALRAGAP
ncbi:phage tail sheath family protein [Falsiroseomonas sp.]|uniref:phage tail sheath family protein n=1 Tax=Falsiroseomonas sp. TaxID=2870721 RepID=UPI003F6F5DF5